MTLACLGLTVVLLLASLMVVLPGTVGGLISPATPLLATGMPALQLLPVLAAIMGLVTAALCVGVGTEISPDRKTAPGQSGTGTFPALVTELRSLLTLERQELSVMQAACENATRETATAGARLARLVADAETQLSSGLDLARQSGSQHASDLSRASEVVVRLERLVPMISRVVEPEASAAVITGAAEAMERAIGAAVSGAASQISAIGDAASLLRRDASALDKAAREIAMAGANVVTRVGEAAVHVEEAAGSLPAAANTLTAAAQRAVEAVGQASAALTTDSAAVGGLVQQASQSAEMLRSNTAALHQAGESFTQHLAGVGKNIEVRLASFPALSQVLGSQAGQLLRNAETMIGTARDTAQASQSAAASAAQVDSVVAGLGGLATQITEAATVLKEGADGLRQASHSIITDGGEAAGRIEAAARDVLEALPSAREIVGVSCAALRAGADVLAREAAGVTDAGERAARLITAENAQTHSIALALNEVSAELRQHVDAVASGAAELVGIGRDAGHALQDEAARATASIVQAAAQVEQAVGTAGADMATSVAQASVVLDTSRDEVAYVLREEAARATASIADAASQVERAVGTAGADLAASVMQISALLDTSRDDAAYAITAMTEQATALTDAGRGLARGTETAIEQICEAMQTVMDEMTAAGGQAAGSLTRTGETLEALDRAAAAAAISGDQAAEQLGRLFAVCTQAEAQAAVLPAAASQIAAMVDLLQDAGRAMPHPDVVAELTRAATHLPELGEALQRIISDLPNVLDSRTAAQDAILGSLREALGSLSGDVGETIRRLEDACAATDAAGAVMASSAAQVQSVAETITQMATAVSVGAEADGTPAAPLRHLDGLEREAAALMREGEALAEAAATGRTEDVPVWLADRTAEILSAVDTTIHRLRSVATAVAFASDAVVQRAQVA